ncbi:glycoside hydrolase family 3 C-terminal domain-containing protein [Microbacterium karelineae]|uniref:glycoside hydrolase family 3 C-terminal domain-containing protein n=1 Tax=Microbacterium karelineae TaxID=2654283 RepID=UPI001E50219A|nr:glycoside hydrolase family 3 C-terminal domain-containing protein [Microbacterium karelineae]
MTTGLSDLDAYIARLTLAEKASLASGASFDTTTPLPRTGLPSIVLTDGPHGVRMPSAQADHLGIGESVQATCFPPAVTLGSTFDPELLERVGAALGEEARAEGVGVLLGPGINIKRSPLCGRNFEYLSEDPLVSGVLGAALVRGLQSQGVGASLKHFAANNQETDRLRVSVDIDPRPLREIYLRGFQRVVEEASPWTVMCSYNRINGTYASQDPWLLTTVLRDEWGFDGLVVSDWGAVEDRVAGIRAGLDLEMPGGDGRNDARILTAVESGELDERDLDTAVRRTVQLVERVTRGADPESAYDVEAHHALAREAAARGVVLLQNEEDILPLADTDTVAVLGEFARTPRYQGAGSSLINPTRLDSALGEIERIAGAGRVTFAPAFTLDADLVRDEVLASEAVAVAAAAPVVLLFLGLPDRDESEGYDREHLSLPANQLALLDAVRTVNSRVVVVLSHGGVVELPFADDVPAIVEGWLGGQAGGGAIADVLYGKVNPSGRLAETIPMRIEDTPAYLDFPGEFGHVRYGEGLFVGYRWYDARSTAVRFPFGHGLSYTTFAYSEPRVTVDSFGIQVVVAVTNTGARAGREVVQLYVSRPESGVRRPPRELKGFAVVDLEPGESREITLTARRADLAHWDLQVEDWVVEDGPYIVAVGSSSRDLRATALVDVEGDRVHLPLMMSSTVAELLDNPVTAPVVGEALRQMDSAIMADEEGLVKLIGSMPISRWIAFPESPLDRHQIEGLIFEANASGEENP